MTGAFGGALRVGVLLQGVLAAVQFDRKFPRRTAKAGDAASAGISTAAGDPQSSPQSLLDIGGIAPKSSCHQGPLSQRHRRRAPPHPGPRVKPGAGSLRPRGGEGASADASDNV